MIKLLAVTDQDFGISKNGKIPWQFKKDLQFFAEKTTDGIVVMGRKTFESIPNVPLKNRINCVLSTTSQHIAGAEVFPSIDSVIKKYRDIWVIGGAEIYNAFLKRHLIEYALITQVNKRYDADSLIDVKLLSSFFKKSLFKNEEYSILEFYKNNNYSIG